MTITTNGEIDAAPAERIESLEPLLTLETQHRLGEAKAEAHFRREEERKNNEHKREEERKTNDDGRKQKRRNDIYNLCRESGLTVIALIFIAIILVYTAGLIRDPKTSGEAAKWVYGLWGTVLGTAVTYFSNKSRDK